MQSMWTFLQGWEWEIVALRFNLSQLGVTLAQLDNVSVWYICARACDIDLTPSLQPANRAILFEYAKKPCPFRNNGTDA